jgi:hypothetical protein
MTHRDSSYYPRRAGVWSPFLGWVERRRQNFAIFAFKMPTCVSLLGFMGALLVPGLAFYLRNPDRSGKAAVGVCAALLFVFIALLGFPVANVAFTLLLSIHAVGFVAYCKPLLTGAGLLHRLIAALILCLTMIGFVYMPLQNLMEQRLVVPLRLRGNVVVVECLNSPGVIRRGDWIAFRMNGVENYFNNGTWHGNVLVVNGINMAPVLALPGDHVKFGTNFFSVNDGIPQHRQPNMPVSGEMTVPEKCWLAWPDLAISGHGNTPPAEVTAAAMGIATVHRDQFVGKAFRHWFWRRQLFS